MIDYNKTTNDFNYDDINVENTPEQMKLQDSLLVEIIYTEEYKTSITRLNYFLRNKEFSPRALVVTEKVITINNAHYSAWEFRYEIIKLFVDLAVTINEKKQIVEDELSHNEIIAIENPKNYQIWNHRELLIMLNPDPNPAKEFPIIEAILLEDNKNYHTWAYRTALVKKFKLFQEPSELEFANKLINLDVRNNSAWNFRYFLNFGNGETKLPEVEVSKEIEYAKKFIEYSPQNVSSWNYLIGIYDKVDKNIAELELFALAFVDFENISAIENESYESLLSSKIKSIRALELLLDIYLFKKNKNNYHKSLELLMKVDPVRTKYWKFKKIRLQ